MAAVSAAAEAKGRKAGASVGGLHRERTPAASAGQSVRGVPARSRASSTWLSAAYTLRPSSGPYTGTTGPGTITTSPPAAERAASAWSKNVTSQPGRSSRTSWRQFSGQTIKYRCTPQSISSCAAQVSTGQNRTGCSISGLSWGARAPFRSKIAISQFTGTIPLSIIHPIISCSA